MYSLNLVNEDPGVPHYDKTFDLLRDFLQPDSTMTLEFTARSIEDVLPVNSQYSTEIWTFGECCIDVAEQIPYHHSSHLKLTSLLENLANSPKLGKACASRDIWGQYNRYQQLRESLRDNLNGPIPESPRDYVNFHAFAANLFDRSIWRTSPTWAIWAQRDAHEGRNRSINVDGVAEEIYVLAAAQWIIWYGQTFFKQLISPGDVTDDDLQMWGPGPLYDGKAHLTLNRWHFWRDGYLAVACSGKQEENGYSLECRGVAAKAAALMDALEKNLTF